MDVDGDATTVVVDLAAAVAVEGDLDPVSGAGQRLVDRVIDHLVDQVVEASRACRSDVHARTPPHVLPAFEDLDLFSGVGRLRAG